MKALPSKFFQGIMAEKTHTVARKQIGDMGYPYFNTRGPMTLAQAEQYMERFPQAAGEGFKIYPIKMDGMKVVVQE